jgi:prephenate dehydratase
MLKVGYLGPEGTFSEEASILYAKKLKGVELIPYSTHYDLLMAVNRGKIDEGVTPIENSIEGTVGIVTDMLVGDVNLMIRQEIVLPIFHYFLAKKGVKFSDITDVVSHPQPIDQCKDFLRKRLPHVSIHLSSSTADAVRRVATSDEIELNKLINLKGHKRAKHAFAAIGTKAAAKLYGLNILASKINDYSDNLTRFVVVAKGDHRRTGNDKTSIVFSISKDKPGGLYGILGEFAVRGINLTKIESRPSKRALGDYFFFIDLQGHRADPKVLEALAEVKRKVAFFKSFGSYPMAR